MSAPWAFFAFPSIADFPGEMIGIELLIVSVSSVSEVTGVVDDVRYSTEQFVKPKYSISDVTADEQKLVSRTAAGLAAVKWVFRVLAVALAWQIPETNKHDDIMSYKKTLISHLQHFHSCHWRSLMSSPYSNCWNNGDGSTRYEHIGDLDTSTSQDLRNI